MVLRFANFYKRFIPDFSKIKILLILIPKSIYNTSTGILFKVVDDFIYLILKARPAFLQLKQAFIKAVIFYYFDLKYYI